MSNRIDQDEPCFGCKQLTGVHKCDLFDYNTIVGECPCGNCLVKVTCDDCCDEYLEFTKSVEKYVLDEEKGISTWQIKSPRI